MTAWPLGDRPPATLAVAVGLLVAVVGVGTAVGVGAPAGGGDGSSVAGATTQAPSVTDATADVRLDVANATVEGRDAEAVRVGLTEVPDGLAGYRVRLELHAPGVANVTGASYPDAFAHTTEPAIDPGGQSVTVEAVDLEDEIQPGATDVTLATVTVAGVAGGETELRVAEVQVDADDGRRVAPSRSAGTVAVGSAGGGSTGSGSSGAERPAEPDGGSRSAADSTEKSGGSAVTGRAGPVTVVVVAALAVLALLGAVHVTRRDR